MKKLFTSVLMLLVVLTIAAQSARDDIKANPWLAGSNYVDYDRHALAHQYQRLRQGT